MQKGVLFITSVGIVIPYQLLPDYETIFMASKYVTRTRSCTTKNFKHEEGGDRVPKNDSLEKLIKAMICELP